MDHEAVVRTEVASKKIQPVNPNCDRSDLTAVMSDFGDFRAHALPRTVRRRAWDDLHRYLSVARLGRYSAAEESLDRLGDDERIMVG